MDNFKPQPQQFSSGQEVVEVQKKEFERKLKENAIKLDWELDQWLIEPQKRAWMENNIKPFEWNEQNGVVIFKDEDKVYAIKSTDSMREILRSSNFSYNQNTRIGVPRLLDGGSLDIRNKF
jgi:hypothetical protein